MAYSRFSYRFLSYLRSHERTGSRIALIGLLSCLLPAGSAQQNPSSEVGSPYIRNFGPADFKAPERTWDTIRDKRGIVYVGNEAGALEYDGVSWRLIQTPKNTYVRTFAEDPNTGRIYAGSSGDFGYLADPTKTGKLEFVSLLEKVPQADRNFTDIWRTVWTPRGVYFLAHEGLFRYVDDRTPIKVWRPQVRFNYANYFSDQLYVSDTTEGLLRLDRDEALVPVNKSFQRFANSRRLILMPYGQDQILVADRGADVAGGLLQSPPLYLYDGANLKPFASQADNILKEHTLVIGLALKNGTFAIGTTGGGVVIFDRKGRLVGQIDQKQGLRDDTVYGMYEGPDDDGLWVNLSNGLARVELPPPVSYFHDMESGLKGQKLTMVRHLGRLYVGTTTGVYRLDAALRKFTHIGTANTSASSMVSVTDGGNPRLFVGSSSGLSEIIHGDQTTPIIRHTGSSPFSVTCLAVSPDRKRIFIGLDDGLASIRLTGGAPQYEGRFTSKVLSGRRVKGIVVQADDRIWLSTEADGALLVDAGKAGPDGVPNRDVKVTPFEVNGGLNVFELGGSLLFTSIDLTHLYRQDRTGNFHELPKSDPLASASPDILGKQRGFGFQEDAKGNIWSYRGRDLVFLEKRGGSYMTRKQLIPHAADFGSLGTAFPEENGVTWFGSLTGLIRYDSANATAHETMQFGALIRTVTANPDDKFTKKDLYLGAPGDYGVGQPDYHSTVRIDFAGPVSSGEYATGFKTYMEGLDEKDTWLDSGGRTYREFTNLPASRRFTFHVRARDANGELGREATYSFKVAPPPWYLTWWAYAGYSLILVVSLWGGGRAYRLRVTRRERARMRAEALEEEARALNAEKDLLAEFSKDSASLDFETIFIKLREHVNVACDAPVFRAGRFYPDEHRLDYSLVMEGFERLPAFSVDTTKRNRMEVWCIENGQPVMLANAAEETSRYIEMDSADGDLPSRIYAPLISQGKVRGMVEIGSPRKDAYTGAHSHLLQNLAVYTSIALDNADAYRQLNSTLEGLEHTVQERTAAVESLSEIGRQITASLDLDTVLDRVYQYVCNMADASVFGVGILAPEEQRIEYRLAIVRGERIERYYRRTGDRNQFAIWCIENRRPVVMNDVENEYSSYIETMDQGVAKVEDGGRTISPASIVYLPLITQDRVLGVITVQSFLKNAYQDYQINLLKNLAAYTSIAIDNATAYKRLNEREREIQQRAAELATVNEVGQAAASKLEVQSLIELVGNKVREVFSAQISYVGLLDENGLLIRFPYGYGREFFPVALGRGMASRVVLGRKPLRIDKDAGRSPGKPDGPRLEAGVTSAMGVPIVAGGEIVGVVGVETTDELRRFTDADLRLLATIASNVGVALHNARLFEEAAQARAKAEAADAAKSDFLSTVSHELRTPLTSVLGFAELIRRHLSERLFPLIPRSDKKIVQTIEKVGDNLDIIVQEGERLTALINDLLYIRKMEVGKHDWNMEPLGASEVVDRALASTSSLVADKPFTLTADVLADLPTFTGDRNSLIQVMINLISNAVKFTSEGSVTCRARQVDHEIVISVTDTGLGIAPADQAKVFEKFKQVGDTLTDKPQGTGLGLPICKEIVEHHGGRIWVESEPGRGSIFSFSIPLKVEPANPQPLSLESLVKRLRTSVEGNANGSGKRQSILVVDDDPHIRELLRQEFQEAGHEVRLAVDGREALNSVREEKPGLIVLDVMMPEMNGFDVAAVLKNDPATMDIPIIMLSIVQDKERGNRLGIDRYLTKPVDTELLFREVDALMEQGKSKKKVMIVDEDQSTVRTLAEVLQMRGYHVVETNGDDLVKQALSVKPDVIILNSVLSSKSEIMQTLRFENGLENVLFLIYQ